VLVGARAAVGERRPERAQLGFEIAHAEADDQPALAEHVDRRELLGQQDRLALGQHDHAEPEPDAPRHGGEVRQRHDRLQPRVVRVVGSVERERDVIADPDRLEPGLLDRAGAPGQRLRRGALALVQSVDAELHARGP
jgi:hypothetical protein